MRSEKRGTHVESPTIDAIDAAFMGTGWPVYEAYAIESRERPGLGISPAPALRWKGAVIGYSPSIAWPELPSELVALADASDLELLAWARSNGSFGPQGSRGAEFLDQVRDELGHLSRTRHLLALLRDRPDEDELLRDAARAAAGHLVDASVIAAPTQIRGTTPPLRQEARADIEALNALGVAIGAGLRGRVLVGGIVAGNRQEMRLQGSLTSTGPIAAAYLRTLSEAATLRIGIRQGSRRTEWRQPRPCERCGTVFAPVRAAQRWCSKQCRWTASKAGGSR